MDRSMTFEASLNSREASSRSDRERSTTVLLCKTIVRLNDPNNEHVILIVTYTLAVISAGAALSAIARAVSTRT
jgi:hypothetical protein